MFPNGTIRTIKVDKEPVVLSKWTKVKRAFKTPHELHVKSVAIGSQLYMSSFSHTQVFA